MSQLDKNYNDLLSRCVEPGVANNWFKGFSGAGTWRTRYEGDYNSRCRSASGEKTPTTSVFTPELIKELNDQNKANQTAKPAAPQPAAPKPDKKDEKKDDKKDEKKSTTEGGCPNNMKGYVFCNHKFKKENVLKGSSTTTEKTWKGCRQRCWDHGVACRGWSWREGSGTCYMYDVGSKDKMIYQKSWASGPRSNPSTSQSGTGGDSSGSSDSSSDTNSSTNTNPTFTFDPPDTRAWWQKDDIITGVENWVLIAVVCCLVVVMGGGMMMMLLLM